MFDSAPTYLGEVKCQQLLRLIVKVCCVLFAVLAGATTKLDDYYRKRWPHQAAILCKNGPVGKESNNYYVT